jgi:hypothetical protein
MNYIIKEILIGLTGFLLGYGLVKLFPNGIKMFWEKEEERAK